jgi:uncharacterized protein (TIGR03067 family)
MRTALPLAFCLALLTPPGLKAQPPAEQGSPKPAAAATKDSDRSVPDSADRELVKKLVAILKKTKSVDTFLVTTRVLADLGLEAKSAVPAIILHAERLGLLKDILQQEEDEEGPGIAIVEMLEDLLQGETEPRVRDLPSPPLPPPAGTPPLPLFSMPVPPLPFPGAVPCEPPPGAWKAVVEGTWVPVASEVGGLKVPDASVKRIPLTLAGGKYTLEKSGTAEHGIYWADERILILTAQDGDHAGLPVRALYEVKGDTLRLCFPFGKQVGRAGGESPTDLGLLIVTYKREKP